VGVEVRPLVVADWEEVREIYRAGITSGDATFETDPGTWEHFDAGKLPQHRHVAVDASGSILGWVAVSPVSPRYVYRGVVEHSVYVAVDARGRGIGAELLRAVVGSTEAAGIWTIQAGVFPENAASLALHERAGFRVIGTRERVGLHHGRWRDVVLIERRSETVGRR
jgi:phosphinothricin acetyltransferase